MDAREDVLRTNSFTCAVESSVTMNMRVANTPLSADAIMEMLELGIERVAVDHFYFKEYRYTDLNDAIAQAKRQRATRTDDQGSG